MNANNRECTQKNTLLSGLHINQSFKLLMLISKCHLNVNVNAKNEKPLIRHSGMLLSRNPATFVCLKSLDPSPCISTGARWDDMFVYALLIVGYF